MSENESKERVTGYTALELWRATRNALIKKSARWCVGRTLIPCVAIDFAKKPRTRFEVVKVGVLNRHKSKAALVNNVTIGKLTVDTLFKPLDIPGCPEMDIPGVVLALRTVEAIAWYLTSQEGSIGNKAISELTSAVINSLSVSRLRETTVDTLSDLSDPKAVSKAYNAFFRQVG